MRAHVVAWDTAIRNQSQTPLEFWVPQIGRKRSRGGKERPSLRSPLFDEITGDEIAGTQFSRSLSALTSPASSRSVGMAEEHELEWSCLRGEPERHALD